MELTLKQEMGLKEAVKRYKDGEKYTVIGGYAGTGKSTLVKFIVEALGVSETSICYAAYTGKATQVLLKKGNRNVSTLHKLLFDVKLNFSTGTYTFLEKETLDYSIIIVDEVSMVPKKFVDILNRKADYVIYLGDPFQLPPVVEDQDNGLLQSPHIFLDEIVRQARENEIIRLSMDIREGKSLVPHKGEQVIISSQMNPGMMVWADQILCGTNSTRNYLNNYVRQMDGRGKNPESGEKVICLKNSWNTFSSQGNPLVNGTIGYLNIERTKTFRIPYRRENSRFPVIQCSISDEYGSESYSDIFIDKKMLISGEHSYNSKDFALLSRKSSIKENGGVPYEFAYGYAITTHKAQGSEWDKVLIVEENFPFNKEEHRRWLYTSVTRASEKVVLIR